MGKWSHEMAEELTRLGHVTTLWFADDFPLVKRAGRFSILLFPVALAFRIWRRRSQLDVVVVHEPAGLWYGLLRRLAPSLPPMTLMCHNVESRHFSDLLRAARCGCAEIPRGMRIKTPLFRLWQSDGAIRLADHVVCLSSVDRNYLARRLGRAGGRVSLQINGVATEYFRTRREDLRDQRALFVGGWLDIKGKRVLPSLWAQVRARFPQARLTIVGSGQSAGRVLADFQECDRASVNVITLLTHESDMIAQYAAHDVLIMPSLSEGSPLSLLEAMAAGLPAVAARVGGIPDIIMEGQTGLLFHPADSTTAAAQVCHLFSDPAQAVIFGRAGQERARRLTWTASAQTLLTAIEGTLPAISKSSELIKQSREEIGGETCSGRAVKNDC